MKYLYFRLLKSDYYWPYVMQCVFYPERISGSSFIFIEHKKR